MSMSPGEFFSNFFLVSFAGICVIVLLSLLITRLRSWYENRNKIQCRICGFRFFYCRSNGDKAGLCPNCGAPNVHGRKRAKR